MNRNIVTITGHTLEEAVEKAKHTYGERMQVLSHREVEEGGLLGFGAKKIVQVELLIRPNQPQIAPPDSKRDLLEAAKIVQQAKEKGELSETLKNIQEELSSLNNKLHQHTVRTRSELNAEIAHPALDRIHDILVFDNDFSPYFVQNIISEIKRDFSVSELEDFPLVEEVVLKEIGRRLIFYNEIPRGRPRVITIVGPTGVGKTTSLAKIAAMNVMRSNHELDVRLINLDSFRIGAKAQIETYGRILNIPVTTIYEPNELKDAIDLAKDADLILVDTIGKSPYDTISIAEMQKLLENFGRNTEIHLAISATSKESDVREILSKFELFRYQAIVLTKIDETARLGAALTALMEARKSISYLTIGQHVPADIERASISGIWQRLVGFSPKTLEKVLQQEEMSGRI